MPMLADLMTADAPQQKADLSLADLARWARLPQSQNIDDRRDMPPDPLYLHAPDLTQAITPRGSDDRFMALLNAHFNRQAEPMESRIPTTLSALVGLSDIGSQSPRNPMAQQTRSGQVNPYQEFQGNMELDTAMLRPPAWLQDRWSK